jgi:hypothetical protein
MAATTGVQEESNCGVRRAYGRWENGDLRKAPGVVKKEFSIAWVWLKRVHPARSTHLFGKEQGVVALVCPDVETDHAWLHYPL